jgi:hypothetical protein
MDDTTFQSKLRSDISYEIYGFWLIFADHHSPTGGLIAYSRGIIEWPSVDGVVRWEDELDFQWTPGLKEEVEELIMRVWRLRAFL